MKPERKEHTLQALQTQRTAIKLIIGDYKVDLKNAKSMAEKHVVASLLAQKQVRLRRVIKEIKDTEKEIDSFVADYLAKPYQKGSKVK